MNSAGRLFVADRANNRIQIFDQDGKFLAEWKQFGRPSGVYIRNDIIYVANSQSTEKVNPPFRQGIRVGSVKDGKVTAFISAPDEAECRKASPPTRTATYSAASPQHRRQEVRQELDGFRPIWRFTNDLVFGSAKLLGIGSPSWIRTTILAFKVRHPAVRRRGRNGPTCGI